MILLGDTFLLIDTDLENLGLLAADTSSNMKKTITLSPAVMDEDLKAALFEDADDEGRPSEHLFGQRQSV